MAGELYLKQMLLGPMENYVYLIGSRTKRECMVVDPAWDVQAIMDQAAADGMTIKGALVTHYHPDHCGGHLWGHDIEGAAELVGRLGVPVYCNCHEKQGLMRVTGLSESDIKTCDGGDKITVGDVSITTLHTPGHTPGSQCFLVQDQLVSGDTLFINGCGRVDLPGGDGDQLFNSLHNTLGKLPDQTTLFPGHHYSPESHATLAQVKKNNPYFSVTSLAEWRRAMQAR